MIKFTVTTKQNMKMYRVNELYYPFGRGRNLIINNL